MKAKQDSDSGRDVQNDRQKLINVLCERRGTG